MEEQYDEHTQKLEYLCRTCGKHIKLQPGYMNAKSVEEYHDVLSLHYNIYVLNEDKKIFPKKVCNSCKKLLVLSQKGNAKPKLSKLHQFQPHHIACEVCYANTQSQSKLFNKKNIDYHLKGIGFHYLSEPTAEFIYYKTHTEENFNVTIPITLNVAKDQTWKLYIKGNRPNNDLQFCNELPHLVNNDTISEFTAKLNNLQICPGIRGYKDIVDDRLKFTEPFPGHDGKSSAFIETENHVRLCKDTFSVIRAHNCELISSNFGLGICEKCSHYKKNLSVFRLRLSEEEKKEKRISDSSTANIRYLNVDELRERLRNAQLAKKTALAKVAKMTLLVQQKVYQEGVVLSSDQTELCSDILGKNLTQFDEETPQGLLWQQQLEQSQKKDSRSMKWHPLIIRWCLSIYMTSPAAYKQIASKRNRFLVLPHINTLKKYINYTKPQSGFNPEVIDKMIDDTGLDNFEGHQRNVSLIFDEMKIKSGLVYKRSSGKLVGFTEMGDINEEIRHFESSCQQDLDIAIPQDFARYVNVFFVRGITTSLCYPFGYHASLGFTADQLFPVTWEATKILELLDLKVRTWVCDGASPNRKLFKINMESADEYYWTWNMFDPSRKIYFMSDVPHLLKTTRNNVENSHGNLNSRNLHVNHQDISWNHIVSLYEEDLGMNRLAFGLRKLPRLREEHVRPKPSQRMKVSTAAQVLSSSVANAMEMQGLHYTQETIKFIRYIDRVFDCLNVSRTKGGGKQDLLPYRGVNDQRFEFLESFLKYLDDWQAEAEATVGMTRQEKARLCLSHQTVKGWHITVNSFIELSKIVLEDGAQFLLSEKFSQDPVEEHFARHRRMGGSSDNPTLVEFQQQEVALTVIKSNLISDLRGNTSGKRADNRTPLDVNDVRLPRKRTIDKR